MNTKYIYRLDTFYTRVDQSMFYSTMMYCTVVTAGTVTASKEYDVGAFLDET